MANAAKKTTAQVDYYDFNNYVDHCKSRISTSLAGEPTKLAKSLEYNLPYELKPRIKCIIKKGIILTHGLFESPFAMRDLANHLASKGFVVRTILLPGHGTKPDDLLTVNYQEWVGELQSHIDAFAPLVDELYLGGHSTGASLSLYLASEKIKGLILSAPAIKVATKLAPLCYLPANYYKKNMELGWASKTNEDDPAKYQSVTFNSVDQVHRLSIELKTKPSNINIPIFIAQSGNDETTCAKSAIKFFANNKNSKSKAIYFTNNRSGDTNDSRIVLINPKVIKENITSLSHQCTFRSPNNSHYGRRGDYHIMKLENLAKFGAKTIELCALKFFSEISQKIFRKFVYKEKIKAELYYNPFFDDLLEEIDEFLDAL